MTWWLHICGSDIDVIAIDVVIWCYGSDVVMCILHQMICICVCLFVC